MSIYPGFRELTSNTPAIQCLEAPEDDCPEFMDELLLLYQQDPCNRERAQELRSLRSILVNIVGPGLGGPKPQGNRASQEDIAATNAFLHQIAVRWLENAPSSLNEIFDQLGVETTRRYQARSLIKKLVTWATAKGFIFQSDRQIFYRFKEVTKSRPYREETVLMAGRPNGKNRIRLGTLDGDYTQHDGKKEKTDSDQELDNAQLQPYINWKHCLPELLSFPRLLHFPSLYTIIAWIRLMELEKPWFLANQDLEEELAEYIKFASIRLAHRDPTVQRDVETQLRYAGWLHREKKIPLEQLQLDLIIPFTQLRPDRNRYKDKEGVLNRDALRLAKMIAIEDMEEETEELLVSLDEYFSSCQTSPAAAINYMKGFINLAKHTYASQTKKFKLKRGFEDIPLIESLRDKQAEYEQQHRAKNTVVIPRELTLIPCPQVLEVVERLRQEFEQPLRFHVRHTRPLLSGQPSLEKIQRTDWARARNLQWFLMLAIMTANPPRRPRVYRELEVGRTLVRGTFIHGVFVPAEAMRQPSSAEWWIHLMPGDYKTGAKYGEWWGKLSNTVFSGGKTLYQYIDEWLTRWRPVFTPDHNNLFTQLKGGPIDGSDFRQKIERLCCRFTGVPVNPHSLRHIYVTYLKSIHATEAELESAAAAMGHSRAMQSGIYDLMTLQDRLAASFTLTKNIGEAFYQNYKVVPPLP